MYRYKAERCIAAGIAAWLVSCPAAAGWGDATEITQLLNHGELIAAVAKQAAQLQQLAQSYVVQYSALQEQMRAGRRIGDLSLQDVRQNQRIYENYQSSLQALGLDLRSLANTIQVRSTEAQLQELSQAQYAQQQAALVSSGNSQAVARIRREQAMAQQIQGDIQLVQQYGNQIAGTDGIHAATQLMNGQLNLLLQQMTRLVLLASEAQGSDRAAAIAKEANDRQTARSVADQIISNENAMRARNQSMLDGMWPTGQ